MKPKTFLSLLAFLFLYLFIPLYAVQWVSLVFLFLIALSFAYSRIVAASITVMRRDPVIRTYRFQPARIELVITNRGFLPVHYLSLTDTIDNLYAKSGEKVLLSFRPKEKRIVSYPLEGYTRGEYTVGPLRIRYADPAGLFPWYREISSHARFIIYPDVHPLELLVKNGLPAGNIRTVNPVYEDITRYRSLREYVPGDETRRISWKASARIGKLFSTEFLPALYFPALVVLNLSSEDYAVKHRYHSTERAIEVAASLVFACVQREQNVGFVTSGTTGDGEHPAAAIRGSHAHAVSILEALARLKISHEADCIRLLFSSGMNIPLGCRIMYVGPPLKQEQLEMLLSLRKGGNLLELYLLPQESKPAEYNGIRDMQIYEIKDYGDELVSTL